MTDTDRQEARSGDELRDESFRHAVPRPQPAEAARARTWANLHADWRQLTARRRRRQRLFAVAASALLALVAGGLWFAGAPGVGPPFEAAIVRASGGELSLNGERLTAAALSALAPSLAPLDLVETGPGTRVAIDWRGGSLRLDEATRIGIERDGALRLERGALYFDSTPWGRGQDEAATIVVATRFARLRHAGTQFQVAVRDDELDVSVREGSVSASGSRLDVTVDAGESIRYFEDGRFERRRIAGYDESWRWSADIAPLEDFSGRTTGEVLQWVARETGLSVRFASTRASALAGSEARGIAALPPFAVLRTIPVMTSLQVSVERGVITVDAAGDDAEP